MADQGLQADGSPSLVLPVHSVLYFPLPFSPSFVLWLARSSVEVLAVMLLQAAGRGRSGTGARSEPPGGAGQVQRRPTLSQEYKTQREKYKTRRAFSKDQWRTGQRQFLGSEFAKGRKKTALLHLTFTIP